MKKSINTIELIELIILGTFIIVYLFIHIIKLLLIYLCRCLQSNKLMVVFYKQIISNSKKAQSKDIIARIHKTCLTCSISRN